MQQLDDHLTEAGGLDESQQESSAALSSHDQHVGDAASQTFQRERDVSIQERLESKRNEVSDALERIGTTTTGAAKCAVGRFPTIGSGPCRPPRYCVEHASEIEHKTLTAEGGWSLTNELEPEEG